MGLIGYLKQKFSGRKARQVSDEHPTVINTFQLEQDGRVQFANWANPLLKPESVTQPEVNFFKKFIAPGTMAIDIGTSTGNTTVPMALAAGRDGVILGFNPDPHLFKLLEANAALNKDKTNIIALPYAIVNEPGEFYYTSPGDSFSSGRITKEPGNFHGKSSLSTKIKGIMLEEYLQAQLPHWLPKLSLIKIFAEGRDKEIIRSIHSLVEKYKPVLISECTTTMSRAERENLFDSIAKKDYDLFFFEDFEENAAVIPLIKNDMMRWKDFRFYAIPKSN